MASSSLNLSFIDGKESKGLGLGRRVSCHIRREIGDGGALGSGTSARWMQGGEGCSSISSSSRSCISGIINISSSKNQMGGRKRKTMWKVRCGIEDFIGGDLVRLDLGRWLSDVEKHKALAIYSPHEGGYEGRYLTRLRYQGYQFLDLSARGLGDPETTLTKIHPVCPAHLGKQPIARWYFPPEVDYRLSSLPPNAKGLVVWIIEAKVLSKSELQFLALLPSLRPKVRVIAECGNWRKFMWKPLKEIAGLPTNEAAV